MSANQASSLDQAISWHLKLPNLRDDEWSEFVVWLESSPENRTEYDRLAGADFTVGKVEPGDGWLERRETGTAFARLGRYAPFGIVAVLALAFAIWTGFSSNPILRAEQTEPGFVRQIDRGAGTLISLNGDSRVLLDDAKPRTAVLERGEALFSVKHSNQPFELIANGITIRDLGTIFNVRLSGKDLTVAVKEGAVLLDPDGANLKIQAGEAVAFDTSRNIAIKSRSPQVGGWIGGELTFEDGSVQDIVEAIHRRSGIRVRLSPSLSNASFTGNIRLSGDEAADVAHLATLLGAEYHQEGQVWILSARGIRR